MDHISIASQSQDPVHVHAKSMTFLAVAYQCCMLTDHRTFGDLFYACCDEVADISFLEALCRILTLATVRVRQLNVLCAKTAAAFFNTIMDTALQCVGLSKNKLAIV